MAIHQSVQKLEEKGIVTVNWLPLKKGNLLNDVALNLEKLNEAYLLADRIPKENKVEQLQKQIRKLESQISMKWIKDFLQTTKEESMKNKNIPSVLPQEDGERELLFNVLLGIDDLKGESILERVFSKKYLGNSKVFQKNMKRRLVTIARKFAFPQQDLDDDDIMAELGIEKTTEELLLKGTIVFKYEGQLIDYGIFPFGGIIDTNLAQQMEIVWINAKAILTIENKTNFHYLAGLGLPKNILLIYIGGFPGPRKESFLKASFLYLRGKISLNYYHWGDIDIGGFRIFKVIQEVIPDLKPLFMDIQTLREFGDYCEETSKAYNKQLEKLLLDENYRDFYPIIQCLVNKNIRLEQEAILVSNNLKEDLLNIIAEQERK